MLRNIITAFKKEREDIIAGPGDDCAVVKIPGSNHDWLLKSDPVIEGTHFQSGTDPVAVGRKAVNRALSDIAAMGGEPLWILSGIVVPESGDTLIPRVCEGISRAAGQVGAAVVGGDLSKGKCLEVHISVIGRIPENKAVLRSGATPADAIYVTGLLGGSRLGKHMDFMPRLAEGQWLQTKSIASSMIDLSDGLASDLRHIMAMSNVGATINLNDIPVSEAAKSLSDGKTALEHALCDGEDFELLFTVGKTAEKKLIEQWPRNFKLECSRIGEITNTPGILNCIDQNGHCKEFSGHGFDHFDSNQK